MIRKLIKERSGCGEKLICLYQILTFKRIRMVQNLFFFLYFNVLYVCIYLTISHGVPNKIQRYEWPKTVYRATPAAEALFSCYCQTLDGSLKHRYSWSHESCLRVPCAMLDSR